MKLLLLVTLLSSVICADIVETNQGTFLEIFSSKNSNSTLLATVPVANGKIERSNCYSTRNSEEWCKVFYVGGGITLKGYSNKKFLDIINRAPNTKPYFEKTYGGEYDDVANAIIEVKEGYLLVGETQSYGEGSSDTYILKVDKKGNKIFAAAYGGRNSDVANAVVEVNNAYMLAGSTNSFGNRVQSIYLSKITKSGDLMWQKAYYSDKDDYYEAKDIIKISDNNLLLAGTEEHVKFFNSEVNIYLNAINTDGQKNGIKRYGGEDPERGNSIVSIRDGYVMAGETDTWGHGRLDAYVVKTDKDGNRVWHNAFGFDEDETANQIIATSDGGFILVGMTDSDHKTQKNVYVVKLNAQGKREWQSVYGSREDDEGFGIAEARDGYVIAGYTKGTKNYDSDVYLVKINKKGSVLWEKYYGSSKDDKASAILKVDGGYVIAGYSTSRDTYSKDMYLIKVDENGNL